MTPNRVSQGEEVGERACSATPNPRHRQPALKF